MAVSWNWRRRWKGLEFLGELVAMPPKSAMLDIIATDRKVFCTSSTFSHRNLTTFDSGKDFFNVYVLDYSQNLMLSEGSLRKVWLNFRKFRIEVRMDDNQRLTDRWAFPSLLRLGLRKKLSFGAVYWNPTRSNSCEKKKNNLPEAPTVPQDLRMKSLELQNIFYFWTFALFFFSILCLYFNPLFSLKIIPIL